MGSFTTNPNRVTPPVSYPGSTDQPASSGVNRGSLIVTTIVPANSAQQFFASGQTFYLVVCTGVLKIKPNNGPEAEYVQGTGLVADSLNLFKALQITNEGASPVVARIFVGFGDYIDNRLIVYDPSVIQAPYPTYPVPNVAGIVAIPDKTGQAVLGINGERYLALNRISLYISNLTVADAYDLCNADGSKAVLRVFPATSIIYTGNGDLSMRVPSGNLNAIISEVYNVILAT